MGRTNSPATTEECPMRCFEQAKIVVTNIEFLKGAHCLQVDFTVSVGTHQRVFKGMTSLSPSANRTRLDEIDVAWSAVESDVVSWMTYIKQSDGYTEFIGTPYVPPKLRLRSSP